MWFVVAGCVALVVAGVVVALAVGSLLGPLLIIGGVGTLGAYAAPGALERLATFLSVGFRRR